MEKKRDIKSYTKDVYKFTKDAMDPKKKRAHMKDAGKVKLPYKML